MVESDPISGRTQFSLRAPLRGPVYLVGDFNGWKAGLEPMQFREGRWQIELPLPAGRYRYGFACAGATYRDPEAPIEDHRHGWPWSALVIRAEGRQPPVNKSQRIESGACYRCAILSA